MKERLLYQRPGKIENKQLTQFGRLREELIEQYHYKVLPWILWSFFSSWYQADMVVTVEFKRYQPY